MKHIHLLAGSVAALVLVACGGSSSSGTGGGTTGGITSTPGTLRIEAIVANPTTYDNGSQSSGQTFVIQDPNDIESLDEVQFQLVYYTSTGTRVVVPATAWSTNDSANTYGTIAYNSGVFTASRAQTQVPQIVSVVYNGKLYSANYQILPRQTRLRGVLLDDVTHAPLSGIEIDFYGLQNPLLPPGSGNSEVFRGKVTTAYDGSFRASVPSQVTDSSGNVYASVDGFTILNKSIPSKYQRIFKFEGALYPTNCPGESLPALPQGEFFMIDYTNSDVNSNGTILLVPNSESVTTPSCPVNPVPDFKKRS